MPQALFIESIRIQDAEPQLLSYHRQRVQRTLEAHGGEVFFDLEDYVGGLIAEYQGELRGCFKLRFEYSLDTLYRPSITSYEPILIDSLYPYAIASDTCYSYKYAERSFLEQYTHITEQEGRGVRSLPIFTYQGLLTDSPYSNIALDLGQGIWLTPKKPLLRGVMRQYLLDEGFIQEAELTTEDLRTCHRFRLINALLPLGNL